MKDMRTLINHKRIFLSAPTRLRPWLVGIILSFLFPINIALGDTTGYNNAVEASKSGDYDTAITIWQSLARENHTPSQIALAIAYLEGNGVEKDLTEAMNWFLKAAEAGDVQSMFNLGAAHWKGDGARQSYAEAVDWWEKAAAANHPDAQFNLGLTYYFGKGAEKDLEKALKWISQAAVNDQGSAKEFVDQVRLEYENTLLVNKENSVTQHNNISQSATDIAEPESKDASTTAAQPKEVLANTTINTDETFTVDYQASVVAKGGGQLYASADDSSAVLGDLEAGAPIKIITLNGDWARVNAPGLARVWVFGRYVDGQKKIRGHRVRARSLPATTRESVVVGLFNDGEIVSVFGDNGQWKQVSSPPRTPLWMSIAQLEILPNVTNDWMMKWDQTVATTSSKEQFSTDESTIISNQKESESRSDAQTTTTASLSRSFKPAFIRTTSAEVLGSNSIDAPLLKLLLKDIPLKVISEDAGWALVLMPTPLNVWVYGRYVEQAGDYAYIRGLQVRARSLPSTSTTSTVLGTFENNAQVKVISKEGDWIRVSVRSSFPAWVQTTQLTILDQVTTNWNERWESERARP